MKLVSFEVAGKARFGAVAGDGIVELTGKLGAGVATLRDALAAGALARAGDLVAKAKADYGIDDVKFLVPVPDADKILCVGVNYVNRNAEYRDGSELPKYPSLFPRFHGSFVGHREHILRPPESQQLDYEGEIVLVIGREGRRISEQRAAAHIAGLTIMNEGTIRDWTRHGKFNVTQGKNWQASGAIGPWLVSAEEFSGYDGLRVITRVNGEVRQDDSTANLMFPFARLINYISTFTMLKAGDMISTGTPVGAGVRFDPPRFLVPGDRVEVEVPGVGALQNTVADEEL